MSVASYPQPIRDLSGMSGKFECYGMQMPQADIASLQELVLAATEQSGCPRVLEVGTWTGRTAIAMDDVLMGESRVYCVDHWRGSPNDESRSIAGRVGPASVFKTFLNNIGDRLMRSIIPCPGESLFWAEIWREPLDMVFIDASHDYEAVAQDIAAWSKHVRPGGVICGHDYMARFPGVIQAADEINAHRTGATLWFQVIQECG